MSKLKIILLSLLYLAANDCNAGSKWVTGYYVGYLADLQPIEAIDWNGLTHVALGVITPNQDGSLNFVGALDEAGRAKLVQAAHVHNRKAIAMIGGQETGHDWFAAASEENRANFIANLVNLVAVEGFDGLDLDWEPIENYQQPRLLDLFRALRATMPDAILTFPIEALDNSNFPAPDRSYIADIAPYLDQINLMTYGMDHTYDGWKTWHSSPLYHQDAATPTSIDYVVNNALDAGVPASKLGLGIAFFGSCYSFPATEPLEDTVGLSADGSDFLAGDNDMSYANIVTEYAPQGKRYWDEVAQVPYLSLPWPTGTKNCTYITYDDEQSILVKGQYVKDHGLGGAIIWNINEGYIAAQTPANPLLAATRQAFIE
jgi:chitinase